MTLELLKDFCEERSEEKYGKGCYRSCPLFDKLCPFMNDIPPHSIDIKEIEKAIVKVKRKAIVVHNLYSDRTGDPYIVRVDVDSIVKINEGDGWTVLVYRKKGEERGISTEETKTKIEELIAEAIKFSEEDVDL